MIQATQDYITGARLNNILDLQRIARGVNMDIAQLDEGPFRSDVVQLKVRDVMASLITSNRRLRLQGNVSFLTVSFISQESGAPKWRGITANPGDVLAANTGESFDLVVPPGVAAYCVSVIGGAETTFRNLGGPVLARKLADTAHPVPCDLDAIRTIGAWLADQFEAFGSDSGISIGRASELRQEFLRQLAACMRSGSSMSTKDDKARQTGFAAVQRVEQHLLENLAIPQSVDDLCHVAGTSRRTLEYAFKECFGTSPKKFIKVLRLNEARKDLLRSDSRTATVVEIASGWGFTHMGQFAADYRRMFSENPSKTLRRDHPYNGD